MSVEHEPHSDEAEWAILAACLTSSEAAFTAVDTLAAEYFYRHENRHLFAGVATLVRAGKPVDVLTLSEALREAGTFESAGGYENIGGIIDGYGFEGNVDHHAAVIRDRWALRALAVEADRLRDDLRDGRAKGRDVIRAMEARLASLGEELERGVRKTVHLGDALRDAVRVMAERVENPDAHRGTMTGYPSLDRMMSGLRAGELGVLAARPSMGKTALALSLIRNIGFRYGVPCAMVSLEMSAPELADRMLSADASVPLQRIRRGSVTEEEARRVHEASGRLSGARIHIDDATSGDVDDVRASLRRLVRREGVGFIVIDYLQLLEARSARSDGRVAEVGYISRTLKHMAREFRVPVLALSQLSRGPESRTNKRPLLSDLRESGTIEQDADFVWMLYRGAYYMTDEERSRASDAVLTFAELLVPKQRNGPTGMVPLHFNAETATFLERA